MTYYSLTPNKDYQKSDNVYYKFLSQGLEDDEVKNIAVTGPLGSGKSSVVYSYFNPDNSFKLTKYKPPEKYKNPVFISLVKLNDNTSLKKSYGNTAFQKNFQTDNNNIQINNNSKNLSSDPEEKNLQEEILNQILHKVPPKTRSFSKSFLKNTRSNIHIYIIPYLLLSIISVDNFFDLISYPNCFHNLNELIIYFSFLATISWIVFTVIILSKFMVKQLRKYGSILRINAIKTKFADFSFFDGNEDLPFSKYFDEIFFLVTFDKDTNVFIFEDLDRLNCRDIFIHLKILNDLINGRLKSEEKKDNKRVIKFIYLLSDKALTSFGS